MITPKKFQSLLSKRDVTVRQHLEDQFEKNIFESLQKSFFPDPFLNKGMETHIHIHLTHYNLQFLDVCNFVYKVMNYDWEVTEIHVQDEYFNKFHKLLCHNEEEKIGIFTVTQFKEIFASKVKSGAPKKSFTLTLKLKL